MPRSTRHNTPRVGLLITRTAHDRPGHPHQSSGRRPTNEPYPRTVAECLIDGKRYKRAALAALRDFRTARPWQGTPLQRWRKLIALHHRLLAAYGLTTRLRWRDSGVTDTGASNYRSAGNTITLHGELSVLTYLHEFGHALGYGERGACVWSINLFRRIFPGSYARLQPAGHMLRRSTRSR